MKGKQAIRNIGYMSIAQMVVMLLSIGMSVFVPKFVGVTEFSYWQLFIFYASYTGCLHLGLNDGIYLSHGGKQLSDKDKDSICRQLWCSICIQAIILVALYIILFHVESSTDRQMVYLYICIYAIINNIFNYCASVLQSINQIKKYSICLLYDKIFVILYLIIILICQKKNYDFLIGGYILGRTLALSLLLYYYRPIFFRSVQIFKLSTIKEMKSNILVGYNLMIANIASTFILGVGRFVVDLHYPIEVFGKVSFAFTLTGFVLALISQVGNSVFPVLAAKGVDFHQIVFPSLERLLQLVLPISYLAYPIIHYLICYYLPQYRDSLSYFIILFPLCVFEAKISMLYNTYMKVLRLEHKLLIANIISVIISSCFVLLSYHIFQNIYLIALSLVIAVIFKAFYLRRLISKCLNIIIMRPIRDLIVSIMCVLPLLLESLLLWQQITLIGITMIMYESIYYKDLMNTIKKIFIK